MSRVLFLSPSGTLGGAEISLYNLVGGIRSARPHWKLAVVLGQDGPLAKLLEERGADVMVEPFPSSIARVGDHALNLANSRAVAGTALSLARAGATMLTYEKALRRRIQSFQPDILHTNGFKMHVLGIRCRPQGAAVVWHVRDYVSRRPVMARLMRWYASGCAMAIANSESVAADVRAVCGEQLRTRAILNATDLEDFTSDGPALDLDALSSLPTPATPVLRVGMLATFARWKGQITFLQAIAALGSTDRVRAYIIGGAQYQTQGSQYSTGELRAEAHRLGIAASVGFTGFLEQRAAALRSLDVVVHASTEPEPFGLVIIEAMACGKPIIVANAGGAAELAQDGKGALVYVPGDVKGLAERISALHRSPALRARLGVEGRAKALDNFSQARLVREVIKVYSNVQEVNSLRAGA